jgi:hypothetical protein
MVVGYYAAGTSAEENFMKYARPLLIAYFLILSGCQQGEQPQNRQADTYGSQKEAYELQEICKKRAVEKFKEEHQNGSRWSDPDTNFISEQSNHYNRKLNTCFVVTIDRRIPIKENDTGIWKNKQLWDINEMKRYGLFSKYSNISIPITCEVSGTPCNYETEWDSLVKPYMEE